MTFHVPPADCLRDALAFALMFGGAVLVALIAVLVDRVIRRRTN